MAPRHFSEPDGTGRQAGLATRRVSGRTAAATGRAGSPGRGGGRRPRRRMGPAAFAACCVAAAAVVALVAFLVVPRVLDAISGPEREHVPVTVTIPEGSGVLEIQAILAEAEVIEPDDDAFYRYVMEEGLETSLKSGTYELETYAPVDEVAEQLAEGPNTTQNRVTVPEGRTVAQTAEIVEESLGIPADEFLAQAKASNYAEDYAFLEGAADDSLEGFLYPKTYDFSGQEATADAVIRAMLDQYEEEVHSLDFDAASARVRDEYGVDMDAYDFLTLASIVEREAVTAEDRTLVTSVFYNRLAQGMALQSDATMMYVTGGEVTAADLETESPYNTYDNPGLTPTPVCSPSMSCLEAVLDPEKTDYLYFFIIEDGETSVHAFSETYEEHQAVIEENS